MFHKRSMQAKQTRCCSTVELKYSNTCTHQFLSTPTSEPWCLQVFMHYPEERTVASVVKKTPFDGKFRKMTVEQLIAKQTRIERCGVTLDKLLGKKLPRLYFPNRCRIAMLSNLTAMIECPTPSRRHTSLFALGTCWYICLVGMLIKLHTMEGLAYLTHLSSLTHSEP